MKVNWSERLSIMDEAISMERLSIMDEAISMERLSIMDEAISTERHTFYTIIMDNVELHLYLEQDIIFEHKCDQ